MSFEDVNKDSFSVFVVDFKKKYCRFEVDGAAVKRHDTENNITEEPFEFSSCQPQENEFIQ
jgi:hypothetical protein